MTRLLLSYQSRSYCLFLNCPTLGDQLPDEIPVTIIKRSKFVIADYLLHAFNHCMCVGEYPDISKIAKVIPIFKSGSKTEVQNYQPI